MCSVVKHSTRTEAPWGKNPYPSFSSYIHLLTCYHERTSILALCFKTLFNWIIKHWLWVFHFSHKPIVVSLQCHILLFFGNILSRVWQTFSAKSQTENNLGFTSNMACVVTQKKHTDNKWTNECDCASIKLYLWILKLEFHINFLCHKKILSNFLIHLRT